MTVRFSRIQERDGTEQVDVYVDGRFAGVALDECDAEDERRWCLFGNRALGCIGGADTLRALRHRIKEALA